MARKINDFNNVRIVDGKIQGLTMSYHFNVRLSEDENPAVCPRVNLDGMPVEVLAKKAWDAMKVSGRPSMKKLTKDKLLKAYHNQEVSWRVMCSQEAASNMIASLELSDDEIEAQIARLLALKKARSADDVENVDDVGGDVDDVKNAES